MSWSIIRKATTEDIEKLESTAKRFADRHNLGNADDGEWAHIVGMAVDDMADGTYPGQHGFPDKAPRRNWLRCVQRALGDGAEGIAYGYVGFHVD